MNKLFFTIKALSLIGIILALYLLWQQFYQPDFQPCNINTTINCEAIINGAVAKTFGIPTPLYGLIGYIVIFFAATLRNKKDILGKLIPFLNGRPLTFETCREYAFFMYKNGWNAPNSRVNIIKNLRAFINFLYDRGYIQVNFSKKLIKPKVVRPPLRLPSEVDTEACIIAGTEPGAGDNLRNERIKGETRLCLQFILRTGLRISEALGLKGQDLSPFDDQPSFQVRSKGGKISLLPIPDDMVEEMKQRIKKQRVFNATENTCNKNLKDGMSKLGIKIPLTCHKLK